MKAAWVLLFTALAVTGALSGGATSASSSYSNCPNISYAVDILNGFSPSWINGPPGVVICWRNQDGRTHRIESDTGEFDSGDIPSGGTFWFSFNGAGPHTYHDVLDPALTGTVNVTPGSPCPYGATVVQILNGLSPATLNVYRPNTTICWRNDDGRPHRVASDSGAFDSGDIVPGEGFSFIFNESGSYAYQDVLYPSITGRINVDQPWAPPPPLVSCPAGATPVDIRSGYFDPATLDIASGTTVCWRNHDGTTHTVTSDTGEFDSGVIGLAYNYAFTFDTAGSYAYHDELNPCMKGVVNVTTDPPPPLQHPPPPVCPPNTPTGCPAGARIINVLLQRGLPTFTVVAGTTVCWRNQDGWTHTVTSNTGVFDSGVIALGDTFSFTFDAAGSYAYHCELHPAMAGTINVARSFRVPRVIGFKLAAAKSRIRRSKGSVGRVRRVRSRRVGRVIAQKPAPGKRLARRARVSLVVGRR